MCSFGQVNNGFFGQVHTGKIVGIVLALNGKSAGNSSMVFL
jgi:hypothetical protein